MVSPLAEPEGAWETKGSGFRELDLRPSQPHPRSHGSTDMDPAGRKQEEMAHRYYKDMGELTRDTAFREGVRRVILAGPSEITAAFRTALTNDLKDRVVAEDHADLSASEAEILDRLEEIRERAEHEREAGLPAADQGDRRPRARGDYRGPPRGEPRLPPRRPLGPRRRVPLVRRRRARHHGHNAGREPVSREPTRVRPLTDVLVDLAAARGENENTDTLRDEFGGLASLTRFQRCFRGARPRLRHK